MKLLKLTFENDGETILLPCQENLDKLGVETFDELKKDWQGQQWGYYSDVEVEATTDKEENVFIEEPENVVECDEFWSLMIFKSLAIESDLYNSPFDSAPREAYYSSRFAYDCAYGQIYTRDFSYFYCEGCERHICEQNPANGWMTQYRWASECDMVCLRCYEEEIFENGVDIEKIREGECPGMFLVDSEIEAAGYECIENHILIGSGYTGHSDGKKFFDTALDLADNKNKKLVVCYEQMAIGGMGGYVSIWAKDK